MAGVLVITVVSYRPEHNHFNVVIGVSPPLTRFRCSLFISGFRENGKKVVPSSQLLTRYHIREPRVRT